MDVGGGAGGVKAFAPLATATVLACSPASKPEHVIMIDMRSLHQCETRGVFVISRPSDCSAPIYGSAACGWSDVRFVVEPSERGLNVYAHRQASLTGDWRPEPVALGKDEPRVAEGFSIATDATAYREVQPEELANVLERAMAKFGPPDVPVTSMCAELNPSQRLRFRDVERVHETLEVIGVRQTTIPAYEAIN